MTEKWSDAAWREALPYYKAILELPFITELQAGILDQSKFINYLQQDALYIDNYARVLAHIASRVPKFEQLESFLSFAGDSVFVEKAMQSTYLSEAGAAKEMSPSTKLYCSVLSAQATAPVEVEAAAILPCFWVYWAVGKHLTETAKREGNPFEAWIATYSDPAFDVSNARAIEICDELAEAAGPDVRRAMTDIFVLCVKLEWMFWNSAYNMEKWEI